MALSIFISRCRNMYIHWDNVCKLKLRAVTAVNISNTHFNAYYGTQKTLRKLHLAFTVLLNSISLCSHVPLTWFCWCLFSAFYESKNSVYCFCDKINLFFVIHRSHSWKTNLKLCFLPSFYFLFPNICFVVSVKIKKCKHEYKDAFLVSDGWLWTFITLLGSLVSLARRHELCDIDIIWTMSLITTKVELIWFNGFERKVASNKHYLITQTQMKQYIGQWVSRII